LYMYVQKFQNLTLKYKTEKLVLCLEKVFPTLFHRIFRCIILVNP
jgi:hypothetical protein